MEWRFSSRVKVNLKLMALWSVIKAGELFDVLEAFSFWDDGRSLRCVRV